MSNDIWRLTVDMTTLEDDWRRYDDVIYTVEDGLLKLREIKQFSLNERIIYKLTFLL